MARQGRYRGFRFKDWADYSSAIGDVQTRHATAAVTATTFQLQKLYTSGVVTYTRKISKPVASTVHLYHPDTGIEIAPAGTWSVDTTTGVCTFLSAPGYVPNATFEFDVPVRFDTDEMQMKQDATSVRSWSVPIVELFT